MHAVSNSEQRDLGIASLLSGNLAAARAHLSAAVQGRLDSEGVSLRPRDLGILCLMSTMMAETGLAGIADLMSMSVTSARLLVSGLSSAGWVETLPGEEDRRYRHWRLSGSGRELLQSLSAGEPDAGLASAVASLSPRQSDVLRDQLPVLLRALQFPGASGVDKLEECYRQSVAAPVRLGALLDVWFVFTRVYRAMRAEQMRFLAAATDHVLDSAAYMALYRANERHCSLSDIATFLRVDQNTAVRVTDRLENSGLVERRRNAANRRRMVLAPTESGRKLLSEVPPLDPNGRYYRSIALLPQRGAELAEVLNQLTTAFLHAPVVDTERLYSIFQEVQRQVEEHKSGVEPMDFRRAMSNFLTGVAVVTVAGEDGPRGMTVNSLTSVSLDPPILLICFDRRSSTLKRMQELGSFGVNILAAEQKPLAQMFAQASQQSTQGGLHGDEWVEQGGVPLLSHSLVRIACDLENTFEAGTHTIVFGRPRLLGIAESPSAALGFWRSAYTHVDEGEVIHHA
jgi:3-hydroxy-9,10-secoandrosta-1,3,5(10)-triene-9,17-dione monooxygenase reductase component